MNWYHQFIIEWMIEYWPIPFCSCRRRCRRCRASSSRRAGRSRTWCPSARSSTWTRPTFSSWRASLRPIKRPYGAAAGCCCCCCWVHPRPPPRFLEVCNRPNSCSNVAARPDSLYIMNIHKKINIMELNHNWYRILNKLN